MKPNLTEEILREFEEMFMGPIFFKEEFKSFLTSAIDKAYRTGRESVVEEVKNKSWDESGRGNYLLDVNKFLSSLNTTK